MIFLNVYRKLTLFAPVKSFDSTWTRDGAMLPAPNAVKSCSVLFLLWSVCDAVMLMLSGFSGAYCTLSI